MDFQEIMAKIQTLSKRKRGGKSVAIVHDDCGCGDSECERIMIVEKIDKKNNIIYAKDDDGSTVTIESYEESDIRGVALIPKDGKEKIYKLYEDKAPTTDDNHIGVEIEFNSKLSFTEMKALLVEHGLENYVQSKDDGSLEPSDSHPYGHELCVLAPEKEIAKVIRKVCKAIRPHSNVNRYCGLHVHIDMRNRDAAQAYANLWAAQPLLYSMCPATRYSNTYCRPVTDYVAFENSDLDRDDRYVGINKSAYTKHSTIEVRIHSGTLNAQKISNWVKLLINIVDKSAVDVEKAIQWASYRQAKRAAKITGKLEKYVKARIKEFKKDHSDNGLDFVA